VHYNSDMSSSPQAIWIDRPAQLRKLASELLACSTIAVDTESNGLYAYQEQVCLLQFSTMQGDYLVDPLSLHDLSPLEPLFADASIEKIFHAAEYDILCLKRDFGFHFANLFDTMIAGRILARAQWGLGSMLASELDVHLDKRHQRANWGRRPLTADMLAYASHDTHYLLPLRDRLDSELRIKGLRELAEEDFHRMCNTPAAPLENAQPSCWSVAGGQELNGREAAILQALVEYRDRQARYANLPLFKIMSNETLVNIALTAPRTLADLSQIAGVGRNTLDRHAAGLLEAVAHGSEAHPLHPPRNPRPAEAYLQRLERLRTWRKEAGKRMGVESDVILPREVLETVAAVNPQTQEALAEVMQDLPWRLNHYGEELLALLNHRRKL
jgi:ribonuclease D